MNLYLSRWHFPVTSLGLGRRIGIWFQGCTIHCPGCVSVDTWPMNQGLTSIEDLLQSIQLYLSEADGITISGGEPFLQFDALEELLRELRQYRAGGDILVYSGFTWSEIQEKVGRLGDLIDVVISEPYLADAGQTLLWRGSDNQIMHLLTRNGRERYEPFLTALRKDHPRALDICFTGNDVWIAGIPGCRYAAPCSPISGKHGAVMLHFPGEVL